MYWMEERLRNVLFCIFSLFSQKRTFFSYYFPYFPLNEGASQKHIFFIFFPIFPLCSKMEEHLRNRNAFHTYFFTFSHYIHTPCKYHTRAHTLPRYLRESSKDLFRSIHYRQGIPLKRRAADLSSSSELRGISSGIYGLLYAILPRSPCAENVFVYKL